MIEQAIVERIVKWNSDRYEQTLNIALTKSLLDEEFKELAEAKNDVEVLDAYCDIAYVAIGALWKSGLTVKEIAKGWKTLSEELTDDYLVVLKAVQLDCVEWIADVTDSTVPRIIFLQALWLVCNSNDTKSIVKTDPSKKANIDKGIHYIGPERDLLALLNLNGAL